MVIPALLIRNSAIKTIGTKLLIMPVRILDRDGVRITIELAGRRYWLIKKN